MKQDQYIPPVETTFATWRRQCGLSLKDAAKLLGKCLSMAYFWESGLGPNGRPAIPGDDTLKLMQVIADGLKPAPYPLSDYEKSAIDARPAHKKKKAPRGDQALAPCSNAAAVNV